MNYILVIGTALHQSSDNLSRREFKSFVYECVWEGKQKEVAQD